MAGLHAPLPLYVVAAIHGSRLKPLYVTLHDSEAQGFRDHFNESRIEEGSPVRAAVLQGVALYPLAVASDCQQIFTQAQAQATEAAQPTSLHRASDRQQISTQAQAPAPAQAELIEVEGGAL